MSGPDQEITVASGDAGGDGVDGGEEDRKESKRVSVFSFGNPGKSLQLWQSRGRKKRKKKKKKKKKEEEKCGLLNSVCCCLCGKQPLVSDHSSGESPCSDPNSKDFRLRVLIEKNDFYAAECNPHLDAAAD